MDRFEQLISSLKSHMENNNKEECCGIITYDYAYIPCNNISPSPEDTFILDPIQLLKYADNCWGIFHSHTKSHDELPSEADKNSAIYSQYHFIMGHPSGTFYEYWLDERNFLRFKPFTEDSISVS